MVILVKNRSSSIWFIVEQSWNYIVVSLFIECANIILNLKNRTFLSKYAWLNWLDYIEKCLPHFVFKENIVKHEVQRYMVQLTTCMDVFPESRVRKMCKLTTTLILPFSNVVVVVVTIEFQQNVSRLTWFLLIKRGMAKWIRIIFANT